MTSGPRFSNETAKVGTPGRNEPLLRSFAARFASNGMKVPGELYAQSRGQILVALHFRYYNFVKIHQSLRTTPAQAAGVTDRLWQIEDLVGMLD